MLTDTLDILASRRTALGGLALGLGGALAAAASAKPRRGRETYDFTKPADNLRAYMKMSGSLEDGAETMMAYEGLTFGVTSGTDLRPLYRMYGVAPVRMWALPDGSFRLMAREIAVFADLATGEVLETWKNPYLDEREVEVWPLRSGPLNYVIAPDKPMSVGGWKLLNGDKRAERGFFVPVSVEGGDFVINVDGQANRKNPLDPKGWPEQSSGPMLRYSEHNSWRMALDDLYNPDKPGPPVFGVWTTHKEWRPWMMMGQRPGHIFNHLTARKITTLDGVAPVLRRHAEKHFPEFLHAPETWTGEYKTDWDYYKAAHPPVA